MDMFVDRAAKAVGLIARFALIAFTGESGRAPNGLRFDGAVDRLWVRPAHRLRPRASRALPMLDRWQFPLKSRRQNLCNGGLA
jgi:hypothetical protein